jgi:hypothetical protein
MITVLVSENQYSQTIVRWDRDYTDDLDIQHKAGDIEVGPEINYDEAVALLKEQNI